MRVLHVIPSLSPRRGGPSAAILPMVAALRARGIDAEIATTDEDFEDRANACPHPVNHDGVPVRFFPRWRAPLSALREFSYSPHFRPWLDQALHGYDLIHVHAVFSHLPTTSMQAARRLGVPYLSRPLGQLGIWPLRQSRLRKQLYLRLIEEKNLRSAAALHFTSTAEQMEARHAGFLLDGFVIPHGIDLPEIIPRARERLRVELGLPPDRKIVLFLGRLHRKKGIDLLVAALSRIKEPRPLLVLAGEGPHRAEIERRVARLGLGSSVRWLGHVTGDHKQLCLQGADLFVLVSRHENLGVAVLESLAAGTPVLISNQVALADEVIRHDLGMVIPLEVDAIRHGLAQGLVSAPDLARARRRDFVETTYTWPANARALHHLYLSVLKKNLARRNGRTPPKTRSRKTR